MSNDRSCLGSDRGAGVTVAVVMYNSAADLPGFLASIDEGLRGVENFEVLAVDNASSDGSVGIVASHYPAARVIELDRNAGYAAGINAAVEAASPSYAVLACNADLRFQAGAVKMLLAALDEPGIGIAVPREMRPGGVRDDSLRREPSLVTAFGDALLGGARASRRGWGEAIVGDDLYKRPQLADWASGAAQLMSRSCLQRTGAWDESFFLYSEETDFHLRARDLGFGLRYVPDAVIDHVGGEMGESPALWSLRAVNRVVLYRRRHGLARSWAFLIAVTLNEAVRFRRGPIHRTATAALARYAWSGRLPAVRPDPGSPHPDHRSESESAGCPPRSRPARRGH